MGKILEKRTFTGGSSSSSKNKSRRDAENERKRKRVNYRDDSLSVSSASSSDEDTRSSRNHKKKSRSAPRSSDSTSSSSSSSEESDNEESKHIKKENKKPKNSNIQTSQKVSNNKNNISNNNNTDKVKKKPLDDKTLKLQHKVEIKKSLKVSITKYFCYECSVVFSNNNGFKNHECIISQTRTKRKPPQESDDEIIIIEDDDEEEDDDNEDEDYELKEGKKTFKPHRQSTRKNTKATRTANTTGKTSKKVKSEEDDEESENEKSKRKAKVINGVKSNTQKKSKEASSKSSSSDKKRRKSSDESEEDEEENEKSKNKAKGFKNTSPKQSKTSSSKSKSGKKQQTSSDESEEEEDENKNKKHKINLNTKNNKQSKQSTTTSNSKNGTKRVISSGESEDESEEEEEKPSKSKTKTSSKNTKSNYKCSNNSNSKGTNNNKTSCEFCNKKYRRPEDLKEHVRLFHKNKKFSKTEIHLSSSDEEKSSDSNFSDSEEESGSASEYSESSASNYSNSSSIKKKNQKSSKNTRKMPDIILIPQKDRKNYKIFDPPLASNLPPEIIAAERNRQGDSYFSKAEYSIAYRMYTQACELVTNVPVYFENRAKTLHALKMFKSACHDCQTVLLMEPSSINIHIQLIRSTLALGEIESCKAAFAKYDALKRGFQINVIEEHRELLDTLIYLKKEIESAHMLGDKQKVLELSIKATAIAEGDCMFRILKVDALMNLGRITEAQNECTQILQIENTEEMNAFALCTVAYCFYQADKLDQCLDYYRQALLKEPGNQTAMEYHTKLKVIKDLRANGFKGNTTNALNIFQQCIEYINTVDERGNPLMEAKLWYNCAMVTTKDRVAKVGFLNQAIIKCPRFAKALSERGKLYMDEKRFKEALRDFQSVLEINPKETGIRSLIDACNRFLRQEQQALVPRKDYYKILGIEKSATPDDVKKAYKKKALTHHPDRHSNSTEDERKQHEAEFKTVLDAYGILSDPIKRHMYNCGLAFVK